MSNEMVAECVDCRKMFTPDEYHDALNRGGVFLLCAFCWGARNSKEEPASSLETSTVCEGTARPCQAAS